MTSITRRYVNGANAALERLDEARAKGAFDRIPALERSLAFNRRPYPALDLLAATSRRRRGEPQGEAERRPWSGLRGFPASNAVHEWPARSWVPAGQRWSGTLGPAF